MKRFTTQRYWMKSSSKGLLLFRDLHPDRQKKVRRSFENPKIAPMLHRFLGADTNPELWMFSTHFNNPKAVATPRYLMTEEEYLAEVL